MTPTPSGETNRELLQLAHEHGFDLKKETLARWHREGLLPKPETQSLGKTHGTQSVYPPGTGRQLLALCEIRRQEGRLLHVAWRLWWEGYTVSMGMIRQLLKQVVTEWGEIKQKLVDPETGKLSEWAWDQIDRAQTDRLESMGYSRKRTGQERFSTLARVMMEVAAGQFDGYEADATTLKADDERQIVERGLGLDRARKDRLLGQGPLYVGESEDLLKEMSTTIGRLFAPEVLEEELGKLTDEDLARARDEMRLVLAPIEMFSLFADRIFGRGAFGLSLALDALHRMDPLAQAWGLMAWIMFGRRGTAEMQQNMEGYLRNARGLQSQLRWVPLLEQLVIEVPALSELLSPRRLGVAFRRPETMMSLEGQIDQFREQHAEELDAFFSEYPEYNINDDDLKQHEAQGTQD